MFCFFLQLNSVVFLTELFEFELFICIKMDLALNGWYAIKSKQTNKQAHAFSKRINTKVDVIVKLEFEIASLEAAVQHFSHYIPLHVRGYLNKFPDFFRMGTFIDSTHMKL